MNKNDNTPNGYRHENKFFVSIAEAVEIASKLQGVMKYDPHADSLGKYKISSVYFDNYKSRARHDSRAYCEVKKRNIHRVLYRCSETYNRESTNHTE